MKENIFLITIVVFANVVTAGGDNSRDKSTCSYDHSCIRLRLPLPQVSLYMQARRGSKLEIFFYESYQAKTIYFRVT